MENESAAVKLTPGVATTFRNPNPANCRFELETIGGTLISIPMPAGFEFDITPGRDLRAARLIVESAPGFGPRPVP